MRRSLVFLALILFYLLHQDFWFWNDGRLILGLPVGYFYHIVYCLAAGGLMFMATRILPLKEEPAGADPSSNSASVEDDTLEKPGRLSP